MSTHSAVIFFLYSNSLVIFSCMLPRRFFMSLQYGVLSLLLAYSSSVTYAHVACVFVHLLSSHLLWPCICAFTYNFYHTYVHSCKTAYVLYALRFASLAVSVDYVTWLCYSSFSFLRVASLFFFVFSLSFLMHTSPKPIDFCQKEFLMPPLPRVKSQL